MVEATQMRNSFATVFLAGLLLLAGQKHALAGPFDYFNGNWECTSDAASKSFLLYHPVLRSQWLVLENSFVNPPSGVTGEFIEYYRYDQQERKWWATSMGSNGLLEVSTSGDWKNDQLIFEGSANFPGGSFKSREIYTRWKDGSLEREHDQQTQWGWTKYSHSVCRRAKQ